MLLALVLLGDFVLAGTAAARPLQPVGVGFAPPADKGGGDHGKKDDNSGKKDNKGNQDNQGNSSNTASAPPSALPVVVVPSASPATATPVPPTPTAAPADTATAPPLALAPTLVPALPTVTPLGVGAVASGSPPAAPGGQEDILLGVVGLGLLLGGAGLAFAAWRMRGPS